MFRFLRPPALALLAATAAVALLGGAPAPDAAAAPARAKALSGSTCIGARAAKRPRAVKRRVARRAALRLRRGRACASFGAGRLVGTAGRRLATAELPAPVASAPNPAPVTPATAGPLPAPPAGEPVPETPVLPPIYSNPWAVQVQAFEFGFQLSKGTVSAGRVRVEFNLVRAEDPHNLLLARNDGTGSPHEFEEQPSGAVVSRHLDLTKGRWLLVCTLPGHESAGMRALLTVD